MTTLKMVKPDTKGRITLGHLADGISRFAMSIDEGNRIILEPFIEVAIKERWLFENKSALAQLKQGIKDSKDGRVLNKGSFAQYVDDETE